MNNVIPLFSPVIYTGHSVEHDLRQLAQRRPSGTIYETETKVLCAIAFHAAYLETHERMGDLIAFRSRLQAEIAKINEALE